MMELRDPIHGAIEIQPYEIPIIDHPFVQRLRNIKQLGFSELSFPGASHNRYNHSIGAVAVATKAFASIFRRGMLPKVYYDRFLGAVRLAALLHDVGHPPLSHATEFAMPPLCDLSIPCYRGVREGTGRATHEDYTIKIITDSSLSETLVGVIPGILPLHVAALIDIELPLEDDFFHFEGIDYRPLLSQIVSSELDVDRMDYLIRDSYFAGVHYGKFDLPWLISNLGCHIESNRAYLALHQRAIYAVDDFLIARYHMFLMIYFHHRAVVYEEMLKRFFEEGGDAYRLPTDIEVYAKVDDYHLYHHLRSSENPWARRIIERRPFKVFMEVHGKRSDATGIDYDRITAILQENGIVSILASSAGILSKYYAREDAPHAPPIYVFDESPILGKRVVQPLEEATDLFKKYREERQITRIYVDRDDLEKALALFRPSAVAQSVGLEGQQRG
ncbi:MAG: HD domain-containing protein [Deltaproteobacteria bacterium]|nr:MAG: HD domain-containing protein [Deltaproteobacteria bacterium]